MTHRTAIIDIGSNSARLVIYEKTSDYGFHLICEQKSRVRIGEGAYEKKGYLQPVGIKRAFLTLKSFVHTIEKYQATQVSCVATSALRDAPNAPEFIQWVQEELGLHIEVIDGKKEAFYGGIAASNLLPIEDGITIDIGGGSSDMALIKKGQIVDTYSLDLGTVRLKELFFDKNEEISTINTKAQAYIKNELLGLPDYFKSKTAISIGGTARTLSKAIMKQIEYPLDKLHAFTFEVSDHCAYLEQIPLSAIDKLKKFKLKKNRYDTIREGTLIFNAILSHIGAQSVVSSSVGVREGVFLEKLLKKDNYQFPKSKNPSVSSILDRFKPLFNIDKQRSKVKEDIASKLYDVLQQEIKDNRRFEPELFWALKLSSIGKTLTIYDAHKHAFYIATQELNYGFTHHEILLISTLLRMHGTELIEKPHFKAYRSLLPKKQQLKWLRFIYSLTVFLHEATHSANISFTYKDKRLTITSNKPLYLAKENIRELEMPVKMEIKIIDDDCLPKNKSLGI